ncbi:MAG: hypothetical protein IJ122_07260 [Methanobrevibacter sp.]|nr:hypothetical protein [Methanobrevibacter sp.]
MPFGGNGMPFPDLRDILYKVAILFGILIVIYGILWLLVTLGVIPALVAAVFPQIVLILVGIFIIYVAYSRRNMY